MFLCLDMWGDTLWHYEETLRRMKLRLFLQSNRDYLLTSQWEGVRAKIRKVSVGQVKGWSLDSSSFFFFFFFLVALLQVRLDAFNSIHSILIEELQSVLKPRCCWTATYIFVVGGGTRIQPDGRERFKKTISCLKPNQRFTLCPRRITWPCPTTQWNVQFSMGKTLFRSSSPSREYR